MSTDSDGDELDALLLRAAELSVRVRRTYRRLKPDPAAKWFVYVLELQQGRLYVGSTDNVYARLLDHETMSPSSAVWVRAHGPVVRVVELVRGARPGDETLKTLEYMTLFGWERVRGAWWCAADLPGPPPQLAEFRRDTARFDYASRDEIDAVHTAVRALARMLD